MAEVIIGDNTWIDPKTMDGTFARGLVPRDLRSFPMGAFAPVAEIPLVDLKELPDRIRESEEKKTRLSDFLRRGNFGRMIPSLNQNDPKYANDRNPRWGYCWAHSTVGAIIALRAKMGMPYVPLSAFGLAYTLKAGRDEGGWAALSLDKVMVDGVGPETGTGAWPRFEQRMRDANDAFWLEAKKYVVTGGWAELKSPVYDRDESYHQVLSSLINRVPVPKDHNWWGHSVCGLDVVDCYPNKDPKDLSRYGTRDRNSWGDDYSDVGFYILKDSKARPDNAVSPSEVMAT